MNIMYYIKLVKEMPFMTTKIVNEVQKQHNADMPLLPLLTESEQRQLAWKMRLWSSQRHVPADAARPTVMAFDPMFFSVSRAARR